MPKPDLFSFVLQMRFKENDGENEFMSQCTPSSTIIKINLRLRVISSGT
jgi:hypothetical protein